MKKLAVMAMFSLATAICNAQTLTKGAMELDFEGNYDHKGAAGAQVYTALGFGYFPIDCFEVVAAGAFIYDDYEIGYHPAVGAQYNFDIGHGFVPFVGGNLGWGIWDYKNADDIDGFVYGIEGGVKYFITQNYAFSVSIDYDWATGDLWMEDGGKMVDNNWGIRWGLRYFFNQPDLIASIK